MGSDVICAKCNKKFRTAGNLSKHNRMKPDCDKKNVCPKCGKVFKRKGHLEEHLERVTSCLETPVASDEKFTCKYCHRELASKHSLERHIPTCMKNSAALVKLVTVQSKVIEKQEREIERLQQLLNENDIEY